MMESARGVNLVEDIFQPQDQVVTTIHDMLRQDVVWTARLSPLEVLDDAVNFLSGDVVVKNEVFVMKGGEPIAVYEGIQIG